MITFVMDNHHTSMRYKFFIFIVALFVFQVSFAFTSIVVTLVDGQNHKFILKDGLKIKMTPTQLEIGDGASLTIEDVVKIQYSETADNPMVETDIDNVVIEFGHGYFIVKMPGKNTMNIYDETGLCVTSQTFVDEVDINRDMIVSGVYILTLNGDFFLKIKI